MKIKNLHSWDLSPEEGIRLQNKLANTIVARYSGGPLEIVAGADIGFEKHTSQAIAGIVLLRFPSLEVMRRYTLKAPVRFPYVPGLLSFREGPILLQLFKQVSPAPHLVFFDGHGLSHPRKLGLASHLGLFLNCPTIGCAKSKLTGEYEDPGAVKGSTSDLMNEEGQVLGAVVRTRDQCKPIYVSVGHLIDLPSAVQFTLQCTTRYRIPEPTRLAHNLVNETKRKSEP